MIDHMDKQTQPLPLEQKRGRGRPAKGQALSNAERQRAYRERQKAQRNENSSSEESQALDRLAIEHVEFVKRKQGEVDQLKAKIRELETQLSQRNEKTADQKDKLNGVWIVESKRPGSRMWKPCGNPETNLKDAREAVDYMQFKSGSGQGEEWRAIRADGLFYWPLWAKKTKAPK